MKSRQYKQQFDYWLLVIITGLAFCVNVLGFRKLLPFAPEVDESEFVRPAVIIASSGNLNPGWFGHPGSTIMYPLAGMYHLWNVVLNGGSLFASDPTMLTRFEAMPSEFYLLGRLLSVAYSVLSIPLTYHLGRLVFSHRTGLIGAWLTAIVPVTVMHAQIVRTDSGALFFGLLGLWGCAKLYQHPGYRYQLMTGIVIGCAVSTRYNMVVLTAGLLAVGLLILWRYRAIPHLRQRALIGMIVGFTAVAVGFAFSTPYFFSDLNKSYEDFFGSGIKQGHLGADGLSGLGNLEWYLFSAIPRSIGWVQAGGAAVGVLAALVSRRNPMQIVLIALVGIFLTTISLSPLHWQRWVIQILPVLSLFAANIISLLSASLANKLKLSNNSLLLLTFTLGASLSPGYEVFLINTCVPSTRLQAREWILANLPINSKIAQEWYGAPLPESNYKVSIIWSLATQGSAAYIQDDFEFLIFSSAMYGRYYAEPDRYTQQVAFYDQLFREGYLLKQLEPSSLCSPVLGINYGGPIIKIYALTSPGTGLP